MRLKGDASFGCDCYGVWREERQRRWTRTSSSTLPMRRDLSLFLSTLLNGKARTPGVGILVPVPGLCTCKSSLAASKGEHSSVHHALQMPGLQSFCEISVQRHRRCRPDPCMKCREDSRHSVVLECIVRRTSPNVLSASLLTSAGWPWPWGPWAGSGAPNRQGSDLRPFGPRAARRWEHSREAAEPLELGETASSFPTGGSLKSKV